MGEPEQAQPDEAAPEGTERSLAGASGDDVSAGTSVSGVGGELLKNESDETGLPSVAEGGARLGWGRDAAETDVQPPARNDGTGQSEKAKESEADRPAD